MKLQQLFEGPYHVDADYRPSIKMHSYPSLEGLNRENIFLGTLTKDGKEYNFWLSHSKKIAKVTTAGKDDIGQDRQIGVVRLEFQQKTGIPVDNELHAHTVYTHEDFRGEFLAGALYILLARYGYSVVSDFEQWNGGKAPWKKMAKESQMRKYTVRIWDDNEQDWMKDSNGQIIKYNASNLDDDSIWTDLANNCEPTTLLVLQTN
jgi:hypothetical protein